MLRLPRDGMTVTRRHFICVGLSAVAAAGLAGCSDATPAPRAVRLKRDICPFCGLPVYDSRYAAEIWDSENSRVRVYDDFGCAVLAAAQRGELERSDVGFWVADESDPTRWLDARSARYRSDAQTPMEFGHAAGPADRYRLDFATAVAAVREKALCAHLGST